MAAKAMENILDYYAEMDHLAGEAVRHRHAQALIYGLSPPAKNHWYVPGSRPCRTPASTR